MPFLRYIVLCLVTFLTFQLTAFAGSKPAPHILLLNSYHQGYKGTDDIVTGFKESVYQQYPNAVIKTEYLDAKHHSGPEYDNKIRQLLNIKYEKHHYNLIFVSDDYAYNILEDVYDELFDGVPVVFAGTNNFDLGRLEGREQFHGVNEIPSFSDTVSLIETLLPSTSEIIVLYDTGLTGRLNSATFKSQTLNLDAKFTYSYVKGVTLEALVKRLNSSPPNTPVIYFAAYLNSQQGARLSSNDALNYLVTHTKQPFFGGWEFSLGSGIVGGKLIALMEHGNLAGDLAVSLLQGEQTELITLSPSPNIFMFDYEMLEQFELENHNFVAGHVMINKPLGFYKENRVEIYIVLSVLLFILLIASAIALIRKERELRLLATTDPLTGLLNRRSMKQKANELRTQANRIGYPVSLAIIDLDYFKLVNDKFGIMQGMRCLSGFLKY